jgi:hypothetical protein
MAYLLEVYCFLRYEASKDLKGACAFHLTRERSAWMSAVDVNTRNAVTRPQMCSHVQVAHTRRAEKRLSFETPRIVAYQAGQSTIGPCLPCALCLVFVC